MNSGIYKSIEPAKNGTLIPILYNNKSIESRYNPDSEADKICNSIESKFNFFLILGLASGTLVKKVSQKFPEAKIVCFEFYKEDIDFLNQLETIKELNKNKNIIFSDLSNIYSILINNYLPAKHGDIKVIEQHAWINENISLMPQIKSEIEKALKIISADYSVQTHFGKIWQANIFNNLKLLTKIKESSISPDINKTAAIIAAGPSFDNSIRILKENRDNYYIISTDTAYSSLIKNEIYPEIVISIDGQAVSYNHFINKTFENTTFLFDLCSSFSAAKHIFNQNGNIKFFISGHPLSSLINNFLDNKLTSVYTGSGTVTIAAVDIANQMGFKKINVFGADFSYQNGKSYTKGTYLDNIYNKNTTILNSLENQFNKLMFRTNLIKENQKYTTEILNAYKFSFEQYLQDNKIKIVSNGMFYQLESSNKNRFNNQMIPKFNFSDIFSYLEKNNNFETALLPYIAWLRFNKNISDFENLLKLAKTDISSYN